MKIKRLTHSWIIDLLLFALIMGGVYTLFNFETVQQYWLDPLKEAFADDFALWVNHILGWMHDTATGITLRFLIIIISAVGIVFLIGWRVLWRLRESKRLAGTDCPHCGYPLSRIRRTDFQRKISKVIPFRRFYCKKCKWKGLRLKANKAAPLDISQSSAKPTAPDKIELG